MVAPFPTAADRITSALRHSPERLLRLHLLPFCVGIWGDSVAAAVLPASPPPPPSGTGFLVCSTSEALHSDNGRSSSCPDSDGASASLPAILASP
jgi:hypothetical protein